MKLTAEDIKAVKYEKRTGYILGGSVLLSALILNAFLAAGTTGWDVVLGINAGAILAGSLLTWVVNRKYNDDLRYGTKTVMTLPLESKRHGFRYDGGTRRNPLKTFPKWFLTLGGEEYDIDEGLYNELESGDLIELHYSEFGEVFLGIYKTKGQ